MVCGWRMLLEKSFRAKSGFVTVFLQKSPEYRGSQLRCEPIPSPQPPLTLTLTNPPHLPHPRRRINKTPPLPPLPGPAFPLLPLPPRLDLKKPLERSHGGLERAAERGEHLRRGWDAGSAVLDVGRVEVRDGVRFVELVGGG